MPISTMIQQGNHSDFGVDAVLTWVDGDDPVHVKKRSSFLAGHSPSESAHATRFADRGELEFCVSSILRFAPWIRRIFIVTDSQVPHWYQNLPADYRETIRIVDHKELFQGYEHLLPTFNSLSIETMVWRIPGLAEHFIYLNDDLTLLSPLLKSDFFTPDGVVLRGAWVKRRKAYFFLKDLKRFFRKRRVTHHFSQLKGAVLGAPELSRTFVTGHLPQPLRKSTLERFYDEFPRLLESNASYRFRNPSQYWPMSLAHHLEIANGCATCIADNESLYLSPNKMAPEEMRSSLESCKNNSISFLCVQSLDQTSDEFHEFWVSWMTENVGNLPIHLHNS